MGKYIGRETPYGLFEIQDLKADITGEKTAFNLLYNVGSVTSILVVYSGTVLQPNEDYSLDNGGTVIRFNHAPQVDHQLYVLYLGRQLTIPSVAGNVPKLVQSVGDGTFTYTIDGHTLTEHALIVYKNGEFQRFNDDFTISGSDITFTTVAPSASDKLDFYVFGTERTDIVSVDALSISTSKIQDGAITPAKLNLFFQPFTSLSIATFASMGSADVSVIESDYQQTGKLVKLRFKLSVRLTGTPDNKIRFTLPVPNDGSTVLSSSVTLSTDTSIESGIVRWGSTTGLDVYRQFGVNYTLDTYTIEAVVDYKAA